MISTGRKIVAIASSTGGPKALQELIPLLPANLNAPVCIVQHMPAGFTAALAGRLDEISPLACKEAAEGDILQKGHLYLAAGGKHMNIDYTPKGHVIRYSDEPPREGVRPCANYMYESLRESNFDEIICTVLTGMGADGTAGIKALKEAKKIKVLAQNQESCTVYGMPKAIVATGLVDECMNLQSLAKEIIRNVGVF